MKSGQTGLFRTLARDAATVLGTVCLIVCLSTIAHAEPVVDNAQVDADTTTTQSQGIPQSQRSMAELDRARQVRCLAEAVYYEAKGEPRRGQEAVAEVVATRVASGKYPKSFCGVVYQRTGNQCQFSWVCRARRAPSGLQWQRANEIAERVVDGWRPGVAPGATHFHATFVEPSWSRVYRRVTSIGGHVFYRPAVR
ncbi:spore cortex-lytic enzyme [Candidatus Phycosocius bacilliformis]|uniref:Spore cortex-lytic enzyme n=1 Tax=Candidatus Phycosocius bacilliformis TaxID=1445552 RepID=A0A2P2EAE6_9PROT|nr:cell wall hydrolase [Candidatus Phycosocius bacilliformis]GBF58046.1 spore cortex-lytic enzyme [Candidatus Phycosocius bacilliformis]